MHLTYKHKHTHGAGKGQDEVLNREIEQMTMDYLEKQLTTVLKKARHVMAVVDAYMFPV